MLVSMLRFLTVALFYSFPRLKESAQLDPVLFFAGLRRGLGKGVRIGKGGAKRD